MPTVILGRVRGRAPWVVLGVLAMLAAVATSASARPHRGAIPWSVLLCKFSDRAAEPQTPAYFRDFLTQAGAGQGGAADYWRDVSGGAINLAGSEVRGWYTMPVTVAQSQAKSRWDRIQDCVAAARAGGYTVPAGNRTIAITNDSVDSGSAGGAVLLDPGAWNVAFAAHEMGHGTDLNHSFSDDPTYRNASWSQIGEYDDEWDVMSAMHVFPTNTARFGAGPPGLNAHHVDRMGWLPRNAILTFGADGARTRTIRVAGLSRTGASDPRLVRIPFDPADPMRYYTVELRLRDGWDAGIPASTVLIHEVKKLGGSYTTYVLRQRTGSRDPVAQLTDTANDVSIRVLGIDPASGTAQVQITSGIADRCLQGFVWREARPGDLVCVTGSVRSETRQENALAPSRVEPGGGPFGPDTCRQGFVWREAYPEDHVCVPGASRTRAREDNAAAAGRRNPARFVYGPNTCTPGFVWREADQRDYVCVSGAVRSETRQENALAPSRVEPGGGPFGPDTCRQSFVWREAYPEDHVCVPGASRTRARQDNAAAASRLLVP
jgi:hypothetical protein